MLLWYLVKGALVGIIIAVPVGPVGVLCVRRTIMHGRTAGFLSGLGAASADAVFGIIAAGGLTFISDWLLGYQDWLRFLGGGYLIYVGVSALRAPVDQENNGKRDPEGLLADFASTFALTITNPITILAFLAIFASIGLAGEQATMSRAGVLVLGVWLGSLLWWAGLAFGTGLLRMSLDRKHLVWINRGSGGILILSGVVLLVSLIVKHFW
ncbi:MAG TPA: LysE family transporter [Stellaceae bacterium]|jgi:threonine/homoserine/homoserine lactone efflux protein|nr:LysE family transporter [Stellaceae bacterium]